MRNRARLTISGLAVTATALAGLLFSATAAGAEESGTQHHAPSAHTATAQDSHDVLGLGGILNNEPANGPACEPDEEYDGGIGIGVLDELLEGLLGGALGDDDNDCELDPES